MMALLPTNPLLALAVVLMVGIAGGIGSVVRALLSTWTGFLPWGVLVANTAAAVFIGFWYTGLPWDLSERIVTTVLVLGFAGALSTFSSVTQDMTNYYLRGRLIQMIFTGSGNIFLPLVALLLITASL